MRVKAALAGVVMVGLLAMCIPAAMNQGEDETCFSKSLHSSGEGMRYWYEKEDGLKSVTGVPYDQLSCQKCHAKSCDVCHVKKEGEKCSYSTQKAKDMNTCLACHARAQATMQAGKEKGVTDVHFAKGMVCTDCHNAEDVHGDGTSRHSMRDEGAVKAACTNCHQPKEQDIRPHTVHRGKLDCTACHVSNSMSCQNCHIENFIKTGTKEGHFLPPSMEWLLLVNYKGKVVAGSVQTAVYKNKKFVAYAPYFTHSVQKKAKGCEDCHGNTAMKRLQKDETVPMTEFKEGNIVSWKGVVPLVPEKLSWAFLNKIGDKWVPIDNNEPAKIQMVNYGEPLTKDQLKKMGMPFRK
jgi:hypothetical protein